MPFLPFFLGEVTKVVGCWGGGGGGGVLTLSFFLEIWEFENLKFLEFGKIYPAIAGRKISVFLKI